MELDGAIMPTVWFGWRRGPFKMGGDAMELLHTTFLGGGQPKIKEAFLWIEILKCKKCISS